MYLGIHDKIDKVIGEIESKYNPEVTNKYDASLTDNKILHKWIFI